MRNTTQPAHASTQPTTARRATHPMPTEQGRRTSRTEQIHAALFSHYRGGNTLPQPAM